MKPFTIYFLIVAPYISCSAQHILKGHIYLFNSQKTPIHGAAIIGKNSNPAQSLSDGSFSLTFVDKVPGDQFEIQVSYKDFEVVNKSVLVQNLATIPDYIDVYLSPQNTIDERKALFYKINKRNIFRSYLTEISKLNKTTKDYNSLYFNLTKSRDEALELIAKFSEKIAQINPDFANKNLLSALSSWKEGKIELALNFLKEKDLDNLIAESNKNILEGSRLLKAGTMLAEKGHDTKQQAVDAFIFKATLQLEKLNFDSCDRIFQKLIKIDSENIKINLSFADLLFQEKQFKKALTIYSKCMPATHNEYNLFILLYDLALCNFYLRKYSVAERCFTEAEKNLLAYSNSHPKSNLNDDFKDLYIRIAELDNTKTESADAKMNIAKLLHFSSLSKDTSTNAFLINQKDILGLEANYYLNSKEYSKSIEKYYSVLNIYTKLDNSSTLFLAQKARFYLNFSALYSYLGNYDSARILCRQAIGIQSSFLKESQRFANIELAISHVKMGEIYCAYNNDSSLFYLVKAKALFSLDKMVDHEIYDIDISSVYVNIGRFYNSKKVIDSAKIYLYKSLDILLPLKDSSISYSAEVSYVYSGLSTAYQINEQFDSAEYFAKLSLSCRQLNHIDIYDTIRYEVHVGDIYVQQSKYTAAKQIYTNVLAQLKQQGYIEVQQLSLITAYNILSEISLEEKKYIESENYLSKLLAVFYIFKGSKSGLPNNIIANCYLNLAEIKFFQNSFIESNEYLTRGIKFLKDFDPKISPSDRIIAARFYFSLGRNQWMLDNPSGANSSFKLCLTLLDIPIIKSTIEYQILFAKIYYYQLEISYATGSSEKTVFLRKALDSILALYPDEPKILEIRHLSLKLGQEGPNFKELKLNDLNKILKN